MPWADPQATHNPTTGQIIPASWGDVVRDDLEYLARNFPHCSIKETSAQSIANATWVALTSNEENSDFGGMHSTSSNTSRITVPVGEGGLYTVSCAVTFSNDATGQRFVGIGKNGSNPTYSLQGVDAAGGAAGTSLSGFTTFVLAAGDYLQCMVNQTSGSALDCLLNDFTVMWKAVA